MSLLQDLSGEAGGGSRPPGRPPVLRFCDDLARGLDGVADAATWAMSPAEQREALLTLRRERARLEELELRVLSAADRNQVGADSGATSTPAWLAHETKAARATCFRDLRLAKALDTAEFEPTRSALAAGAIDGDKARIVIAAVDELSSDHDDLPADIRPRAQAHMLELATVLDPAGLRQAGKRLFEVVCPEAADAAEGAKLEAEEKRARRRAHLSLRDNGDGTTDGRFRLPTLHAGLLKKVLEQLTSPRVLGDARFDPETGKKLEHSTLLGHGLIDLLENHLDTSSLPSTGGSAFTLVVNIGLEALLSGIGVATVETGHRISAGEARRLACKAGLIPMVLDGESVPVDLGRERRLFSKHQKIAIDHRYGGCAAENCDRPPAWMEYHHKNPWHRGGRTDLADGVSFCPPHHHMADHPESWLMVQTASGGYRFSRRT